MFSRLFTIALSIALLSIVGPALGQFNNTNLYTSQTLGASGVYVVMNPGITVTLPTWKGSVNPQPIIIIDGTGNSSPNITINAPLGGTVNSLPSVTLSNPGQGMTFDAFQNGNTWVVAGAYKENSSKSNFFSGPSNSVIRPATDSPPTYTPFTGWCNSTSACASVFTFPNACLANGGHSLLVGVDIYSNQSPVPATPLQGILWLFNVSPGTVISDNATFKIASGDYPNLTGGSFNGIPFVLGSTQATGASDSGVSLAGGVLGPPLGITCAAGSTTIYGMVEVVNAYQPVPSETLTINLNIMGLN